MSVRTFTGYSLRQKDARLIFEGAPSSMESAPVCFTDLADDEE